MTSAAPLWKALTKFYQRKYKLQPSNGSHNFYGPFDFSAIFPFLIVTTSVQFFNYINVFYHALDTCDIIYLSIFTREYAVSFLKVTRFCASAF